MVVGGNDGGGNVNKHGSLNFVLTWFIVGTPIFRAGESKQFYIM